MSFITGLIKSPRILDIDVTVNATLYVLIAIISQGFGVSEDLPKEEWLKFFEELKKCAVMNVCYIFQAVSLPAGHDLPQGVRFGLKIFREANLEFRDKLITNFYLFT